jgi:hypothetical protein
MPGGHITRLTADQAQRWRDVLPIHPACVAVPPISAAESQALGRDIRANGLRNPIVLLRIYPARPGSTRSGHESELVLLDGASRLDAMEREGFQLMKNGWLARDLGLEAMGHVCTEEAWIELDSDIDPAVAVKSFNVHRRHLTAEQKRDLIAKLIKATPEKSDRQIAETATASPTTVGTVRAEMEAKGDVSKLDTRTDSKGRQQPARKTTSKTTSSKAVARSTANSEVYNDIGPASSGEIARRYAEIEDLAVRLKHAGSQNIVLRSEVRELTAALANKLAAVSNEQLLGELERRLPAKKSAIKAIARALGQHNGPVLDLKAAPITNSDTKH